jgi:hypothetical protein
LRPFAQVSNTIGLNNFCTVSLVSRDFSGFSAAQKKGIDHRKIPAAAKAP